MGDRESQREREREREVDLRAGRFVGVGQLLTSLVNQEPYRWGVPLIG